MFCCICRLCWNIGIKNIRRSYVLMCSVQEYGECTNVVYRSGHIRPALILEGGKGDE